MLVRLRAEIVVPDESAIDQSRLPASTWCGSRTKRAFDLLAAAMLLLLLSPFILLAALAVKLTSPGPMFFRQIRVGSNGRNFPMWKLRTMRTHCSAGPSTTRTGDQRLTAIGIFLRRFKIDEFPQLLNVIGGDMSLVGSRPMLPHHETQTLRYRPGITGAASLAFCKEEQLLNRLPDCDLDEYQVKVLMPLKRQLDRAYMHRATLLSDLSILVRTVLGSGDQIEAIDTRLFQQSLVSLDGALAAGASPVAMPRTESAKTLGHRAGSLTAEVANVAESGS
jgi:lipopolysaccharide/colanic/teichoic acid biosynthesis glycosyltransferase